MSRAAVGQHGGGPLRITADIGNTLSASASDSDLTISCSTDADVTAAGSVVLPGRLATRAARSLAAGPVSVVVDGSRCRIADSAGAVFSLAVLDVASLRPTPQPDAVERPAPGARDAIARVLSAAARDETRQQLCAVLVSVGERWCHTAATDSYRLATASASLADADAHTSVLIPTRAGEELLALFDTATELTVAADGAVAAFTANGARLVTRLVPGPFPSVAPLLAAADDQATVAIPLDVAALAEVVSRVRLVADCNGGHVSLQSAGGALTVAAAAPQVGDSSQSLPVNSNAAHAALWVNPRFLLDGLESLSTSGARLLVSGPSRPVRLADDNDFVYLLMPSARHT